MSVVSCLSTAIHSTQNVNEDEPRGVMKIRRLEVPQCAVGEGPLWDVATQHLFWIDIIGKTVHCLDPSTDQRQSWSVPKIIGSMATPRDGNAIVALADDATVDAEIHVWSAIREGTELARFRPDGGIVRTVDMPLKLPGSVMFGGPNLDRIYVPALSPAFPGRPADPWMVRRSWLKDLAFSGSPGP